MNCKFCEKIWSSKDEYKKSVASHWEEDNAIVIEDGRPRLYIPIEGDTYYSDTYMDLNYCPKCGRKLTDTMVYLHKPGSLLTKEQSDALMNLGSVNVEDILKQINEKLPDGCSGGMMHPIELEDEI